MTAGGLLLLIHAGATLYMTGLIWFVQMVHYPLFNRVGAERWEGYASAHRFGTTWVVGPPMLVELATAVALVVWRESLEGGVRGAGEPPVWSVWLGLGAVVALWLSTAVLQVPQHRAMSERFHARAHRRLVLGNWLRTLLWSGRGVLVLWWLGRAMARGGVAS